MSDVQVEAIGGWLKDADHGLDRSYRRLGDIPAEVLNTDHLAYFEDYRRRYFNDRLVPGQGVEEILESLQSYGGTPRRWIDLGAGVTTLFWSIGVNRPGSVSVCDLVPEALHVLSNFKARPDLPQCYVDALQLVGRDRSEFDVTRSLLWEFHVMDCLKSWSLPEKDSGYDLITAIGCFGLASGPTGYEDAFLAAADRLAPKGRLIGADWIRSEAFIEKEAHDNRYLGEALTVHCASHAGLTPIATRPVKIADDPYYDAVVVWAFSHDG